MTYPKMKWNLTGYKRAFLWGFWKFKIPHKCSHIMGCTINPFISQTLMFWSVGSFFFSGCPSSFVDHKMERCERMAWMQSTHKTKPSIHNTSMTWLAHESLHFHFRLSPGLGSIRYAGHVVVNIVTKRVPRTRLLRGMQVTSQCPWITQAAG